MDIKKQAITEYLMQGVGYRELAKKYGVSRTMINKWVYAAPVRKIILYFFAFYITFFLRRE